MDHLLQTGSSSKEVKKFSDFYRHPFVARCHRCDAEVSGNNEGKLTQRIKFLRWKIDGRKGLICYPCQELEKIGWTATD